ncbi:LemA family protein [Acinetobacter baumannii]|uniref:LemA family protein n=1 Tax=Acinetobacter baumannii TaxID=470 RepID=UPI0004497A7A|nr:LemA family protein [Acinetobacter baumannii]AIL76972.1 membrane protein [Acinetobacter baumannii]ELA9169726.1 LemA family protein [Acinetobacter baumannii]EME4727443.1 LemA family protein [Acinetobacter baumannii]EXA92178.1 lemA family protein [Acinetobacter baumannii 1267820]KAB1096841.1 LemA family protein [Acinetobacter baumannii]
MKGLFIFWGIFVVLIAWGIHIRNNIVRYFNATKRAWAEVANFERQKVKTLEALETTLNQYTQFEKSTLEQVTALRQQILSLNVDHTDIAQLQQIEKMSKELIRSLNVVVENYPELKADTLYSKMMDDIQEQNENVGAAISIFNRNVEVFNNQIEVFPNNIINTMTLSKKTIRPFRDNLATDNFDYKPNF